MVLVVMLILYPFNINIKVFDEIHPYVTYLKIHIENHYLMLHLIHGYMLQLDLLTLVSINYTILINIYLFYNAVKSYTSTG
jgi:hypothetical protein